MNKLMSKIAIIIITIFIVFISACDTTIPIEEEDQTRIKIINNTVATIIVYYAQEEYDGYDYDFRAYSEDISAGGSEYVKISDVGGLRNITVVSAGVATTVIYGVDFTSSYTVN